MQVILGNVKIVKLFGFANKAKQIYNTLVCCARLAFINSIHGTCKIHRNLQKSVFVAQAPQYWYKGDQQEQLKTLPRSSESTVWCVGHRFGSYACFTTGIIRHRALTVDISFNPHNHTPSLNSNSKDKGNDKHRSLKHNYKILYWM